MRSALCCIVVMLGLASCKGTSGNGWIDLASRPAEPEQVLALMGTVHHLDLEGGVWVIRDAQGTSYQPTNLPAAFAREGLAIEAEARKRDDMVSSGMVGPLVELIRIRAR